MTAMFVDQLLALPGSAISIEFKLGALQRVEVGMGKIIY